MVSPPTATCKNMTPLRSSFTQHPSRPRSRGHRQGRGSRSAHNIPVLSDPRNQREELSGGLVSINISGAFPVNG